MAAKSDIDEQTDQSDKNERKSAHMCLNGMTRATIDLDALAYNLKSLKESMDPQTRIAAVVKADAYGHGAIKCSEVFIENGADYLAVANIREAMELRKVYQTFPLFIMGFTPNDYLYCAVENDLTITLFSLEQARIVSECASSLGKNAKVHIKIDTGFNRLGYKDFEEAVCEIDKISKLKNVALEGIFSHLALKDTESDEKQFDKFDDLLRRLSNLNIQFPIRHICDSIAAVAYPEYHLDMVRIGALLYGYCSRKTAFELKPAMTLKTNISHIKKIRRGEGVSYDFTYTADADALIATLPIGYADGLPRSLSNKGFAVISGKRAPIVGIMCMDQCMVNATEIEDVKIGDEACFFGGEINGVLSLTEVAGMAGTNRNELLSRIARRVPRVYVRDGRADTVADYLNIGSIERGHDV